VGKATAYKIWELRKSTEITPEILATISHLKMEKVLPLIDFSISQEIFSYFEYFLHKIYLNDIISDLLKIFLISTILYFFQLIFISYMHKSFIVENLFICNKYKVSVKFSIMNSGDKLHINVCSFDDLLGLPSVGKATAYKIFYRGTNFLQFLVRWKSLSVAKLFPSLDGKWLPRSLVLFLLICAAPKFCKLSYGDMFSSFDYAKSSNPHEHNTVKQEPTQTPPPGPSGVSSQTSKHAPSRQYSGEDYCSTPVTSGTSQGPSTWVVVASRRLKMASVWGPFVHWH
jgi:hypothetical protein